jgi:hypothetical protein
MTIYHRIETAEFTLAELATNQTKRNALKRKLDAFGENGWAAVQITEAEGVLLVLLTKQEA